jgi:predicted CXXCH cytochrome family protein
LPVRRSRLFAAARTIALNYEFPYLLHFRAALFLRKPLFMWELLLIAAVVAGTAWLVRRILPAPVRPGPAVGWVGPVLLATAAVGAMRLSVWYVHAYDHHGQAVALNDRVPAQSSEHGFVSAASCRSCHPKQHASWHDTYHRTMTQKASDQAVRGDFDDAVVEFDGVEYQMFRLDEQFWARLTPIDHLRRRGAATEVQIFMTTGSHHYQIYWMSPGEDRSLLAFPLAYLLEDQRWIPREAALVMPPQLKQRTVLWNGICIRCHSTHGQPRIDMATHHADTTVADLGISCEACHGPGGPHIAANQNPARRYQTHVARDGDPTIVHPERLSAADSAQICGQCHSIASFARQDWWSGHWNGYQAGQELSQAHRVIRPNRPETLVELREALAHDPEFLRGRFWSDGMVRVSGREYNGLIESPCFEGGKLSCLSCHSLHDAPANDQLADGMDGDQACFQCHQDHRDKIAEHTHHATGSAGSRCYNCHMPHTNYGLLKAIRSHQVSSPTVASTLATGRPNACNQCHLDKTLDWTQQHLANWYGTEKVQLDEAQRTESAMATLLLKGDAGQRALAAWSMGWDSARQAAGEKWIAPYLAQLFDDPYPAVRYIAARSLKRIEGFGELEYDFVGSQPQRQQAQQRVLQQWEAQRPGRLDQTGASVLIDAEGHLDRERFDELLKRRDNRDIDLQE